MRLLLLRCEWGPSSHIQYSRRAGCGSVKHFWEHVCVMTTMTKIKRQPPTHDKDVDFRTTNHPANKHTTRNTLATCFFSFSFVESPRLRVDTVCGSHWPLGLFAQDYNSVPKNVYNLINHFVFHIRTRFSEILQPPRDERNGFVANLCWS